MPVPLKLVDPPFADAPLPDNAHFAQSWDRFFRDVADQLAKLGDDLATERSERTAADGALSSRVSALEGRMTSVEARVTALEGRMTSVEARVTALEGRMTSVEARVTALEAA